MKITCKENCGNAPRKLLLKNLNIAFAEGDVSVIKANVTNDVLWDIIGDKKIEGGEQFSAELEDLKGYTADELIIDKIITHGRSAAANGLMRMKDGKTYAFCDVYEFSGAGKNAQIRKITSYCLGV